MKIAGIQRLSVLDFPTHPACVVFLPGCNFRCGFCHNPEMVLPEKIAEQSNDYIPLETFYNFLHQREGLLEGVCITGGEPTLHTDLPDMIRQIKRLGFLVKLDTNGTNPEMLENMLAEKLLDYVAMDIKAAPENYAKVAGVNVDYKKIQASIGLIMKSAVEYEFRTTVVPGLHTADEIRNITKEIMGARQYFLQNFRAGECLDLKYKQHTTFTPEELEELLAAAQENIPCTELRA